MGGLRGVLEASWTRRGASWDHSWMCLRENVEKRSSAIHFLEGFWEPKWKQKSLKFMFKLQLAFPGVFTIFFTIFHAFESQLVKTCPRKILAKHWLGAQKSRFAWDRQAESLSPNAMANIAFQTPKRHEHEVQNQAKSGQVKPGQVRSGQVRSPQVRSYRLLTASQPHSLTPSHSHTLTLAFCNIADACFCNIL